MLLSAAAFLVLNYEGPTREACVLCAQVPSVVPDSFATLWALARQSPLSMRFSRKEYCGGLPCPPPGDHGHASLTQGSNLLLLCLLHWQVFFTTGATWEVIILLGFIAQIAAYGPVYFFFFFFNLFIFGCARSSLLSAGFLWLWQAGLLQSLCMGFLLSAFLVIMRGLSCPMACEIFLDQGLNPCSLHQQVNSFFFF